MTKTELVFTAEQSEGQHRTMYVNISEEFPLWGCYSTTTQKAIIDSYITNTVVWV